MAQLVTADEWFAGGRRIGYDATALWRHHDVRRTIVVTFDYSSLTLLELLRRELAPTITAIFMVNGGLFADAHSHPWQGPPMLVHDGAGFVREHRRNAARWDFAAIARELNGTIPLYVGGSAEDPYEHRQIPATRKRVPEAEIIDFPGGHLTTAEHPDLLAEAITTIAARHGVARAEERV